MMLSRKHYGQDAAKHIEGRNEYLLATCDDKGDFTDDEVSAKLGDMSTARKF